MAGNQIRKEITLSKENVQWYEETHGSSLSWILNLLLESYREAVTKTPKDYAAIGAKVAKELANE